METGEASSVPSTAAAAVRRSLFGSRLATIGLVSLGAMLIGAAGVPLMLSDPVRLSQLAERALPNLRADIRIGRARIGWVGPIVIEEVRIVPRDGRESPLRIATIEGNHGLAAILLSWGDLGRLSLRGVEGHLAFDQERRSNLATMLAAHAEDASTPPRAAPPRRSPLRMRLEIDDAVLRITGPWTPDPWVSDPIRLSATLAGSADGTGSEWTIDPVAAFSNARLEPAVAQGVLKYAAPLLADAATTSGRFSLRLDGARFPVGDPDNATLSGTLSLHEVVVGPGPLVFNLLSLLPRLPRPPEIAIAHDSNVAFRLEHRRVWHEGLEFGIPLVKPGQRLDLSTSGWVSLPDERLDLSLRLPIPADLPQDRPLLAALAGKTISVGVEGPLGAPRVVIDRSLGVTAGEVAVDFLDRLRGGPTRQPAAPRIFPGRGAAEAIPPAGDKAAAPTDAASLPEPRSSDDPRAPPAADPSGVAPAGGVPSAGDVIDVVGGILEEVARRRAERRANEDPAAEAAPRRGGRGLLRGRLRGSQTDPPAPPSSAP